MAEKKFNKQQIDRVFEASMRGGIEGAKAAMVEEGGGEDDQGAVLQAITRMTTDQKAAIAGMLEADPSIMAGVRAEPMGAVKAGMFEYSLNTNQAGEPMVLPKERVQAASVQYQQRQAAPAPAATPVAPQAHAAAAAQASGQTTQPPLPRARPAVAPSAAVTYSNQGAVRSYPLDASLEQALNSAGAGHGVTFDVHSGGQDAAGRAKLGSSSARHNDGRAGDMFMVKDGRRLDAANPNELPIITGVLNDLAAAGVTGVGSGPGYMGGTSDFHIGFGSPRVWGSDKTYATAPQWLRDWATQALGYNGPGQASTAPTLAANKADPSLSTADAASSYVKSGERGSRAGAVQSFLSGRGYDLGKFGVDEAFGPATDAAVRQFQANNGLGVDGVVGPQTEGKMRELGFAGFGAPTQGAGYLNDIAGGYSRPPITAKARKNITALTAPRNMGQPTPPAVTRPEFSPYPGSTPSGMGIPMPRPSPRRVPLDASPGLRNAMTGSPNPSDPMREALLAASVPGSSYREADYGSQSSSGRSSPSPSGGSSHSYTISPDRNTTTYKTSSGRTVTIDRNTGQQTSMSGGKVMCTYMMRRGWLPREIWTGESRFALTRLSEATRRGYRIWATPLVLRMQAGDERLERFWWPIVKAWANEAAHRSGVASAKSTIFGKLVRRTLEPMSWMVGMVGTLRRLSFRTEFRYAHD